MKLKTILLVLLMLAAGSRIASAQNRDNPTDDLHPDAEVSTAPVVVDGRVLFRVRGVTSFPATARAAAIAGRIERVARDAAVDAGSVRLVDAGDYSSVMAGNSRVMALFDADARIEQVERHTLGMTSRDRIVSAIEDYRRERSPESLRQNGLAAAGATLLLLVSLGMLIWASRRLDPLLQRFFHSRIHNLGIQSFAIVRAETFWIALRVMLTALRVLAVLAAVFVYLEFVLGAFPWTRGFASHLGELLLRPLRILGQDLIGYIPDLAFLIVLALIVRLCLRLIRLFFDAVARGAVSFPAFEADWAWPTYKIVRFAVLTIATIIAYPYIPGSDSAAFKGVSLLLGVVVSLGSSSAIANLIAGLMITYRRAFRVGDRVQIGDVSGEVMEVRLQATHLRTLKNEEVSIPNSVILNGHVVNFSSLAKRQGLILHSKIGIGYETPWRQVEAMLLLAVERTPGLLAEPPPFVLHQSLDDFCVNYEINAYCNDAKQLEKLRTAMSRNILDLFNEYGVQIMTPAYEGDPREPKLVPQDQWYAAPALSGRMDDPTKEG